MSLLGDEDDISQKNNSLLSNEDENPEKLNLNKKKGIESDRDELLIKEEKEDKDDKDKESNREKEENTNESKLKKNSIEEKEQKEEKKTVKSKKSKKHKKVEEEPKAEEEPKEEKKVTEPKEEKKITEPQEEKKVTEPNEEKKLTETKEDKKVEESKEAKKVIDNKEKKLNEYKEEKKEEEQKEKEQKEKEEKQKKEQPKEEEKKKEEIKEDQKEKDIEKKAEKSKQMIEKKIKFPIVPYRISPSYSPLLLSTLKNENRLRPKVIFEPERDDITRNIKTLDEEEKLQRQIEEAEDRNVEDKEREDKIFLTKYKESALLGNTMIQDPMAVFSGAEKVYIDQFYKISDLFVICPLYFNYRISLEYKISDGEYAAYHLFNTKEISPPCTHDLCANQAREIDINIFNFILNSDEKKILKFIKLKKNCRCAFSCFCACCSRPTFIVETPCEMIGSIIEMRTLTDPIIHVTDINNDIIYIIKAKCSDCGYCCRDQCCDNRKCAVLTFIIYDKEQKNGIGIIQKDHRSGKKIKPDYDQLSVTYPPGISCQDKVLLMCTAIVIEYLYFQNLSNTKRCSGKPRFKNAYSD